MFVCSFVYVCVFACLRVCECVEHTTLSIFYHFLIFPPDLWKEYFILALFSCNRNFEKKSQSKFCT